MSTVSSASPSDAQLLVDFLKFLKEHPETVEDMNKSLPAVWYILISCAALLAWDYIVTFDQEVNYVWTSPWFIGLPLFYLNRYIPFIDVGMFVRFTSSQMTQQRCNVEVQVATWLISVPSFLGQMIIVLRTCALWHNDFFIVLFMILLMISTLLLTSIFSARSMSHYQFAPTPSFVKGCIVSEGSNDSLYIYIALFVSELVIISLTIVKAVEHLRNNRTGWVSQLYKNGIIYCIIILAFSLTNIIVPVTNMPYPFKQALRMPQHVLHSMFCNRVFLQLLKHRYHFHQARRPSHRRIGTRDSSHSSSTAPELDTAIGINTTSVGSAGGVFTSVMLDPDPDSEILTNRDSSTDLEASRSKPAEGVATAIEMEVIDCNQRRESVGSKEHGVMGEEKARLSRRDGWIT